LILSNLRKGKNMGDNELIAYKIITEKQKEKKRTKKKRRKKK
jgi:hypothetical protein